jgi:hypothetical protein
MNIPRQTRSLGLSLIGFLAALVTNQFIFPLLQYNS